VSKTERHSCVAHWVALELAGFSHQGSCEECCDLPRYRRALTDFGEESVRAGIALLDGAQRDYAERMLAQAIKEEQ
jgi:hypothetical protein